MTEFKRNIIVTGGAGFIGSHVVRLFVNSYPDYRIINVDKLTYAGNLSNLNDVVDYPNYVFIKADICDFDKISQIISEYNVDGIIHLAAESHVDRSIRDPFTFARTNVLGTLTLLETLRQYWQSRPEQFEDKLFYHISTDEVYGSLQINTAAIDAPYGELMFTEQTPYKPHSPYSASKASSDHFVRAYGDTYGMPIIISNCSNNYGPFQFPEKLIPLFINNICNGKQLPIYGEGNNVRDWLYVEDHARAIDLIFNKGRVGQTYNIGGCNEWKNIDIVRLLIDIVDSELGNPQGYSLNLITHIADRAGHDQRYAIDASKLRKELGWQPSLQFEEGLRRTVKWYLNNLDWVKDVTSGEYLKYYKTMYGEI